MAIDNATMLERIRKDYLNTVKTLAKIIDANDPCTKGHCDKVMRYSLAISRKMRLGPRDENAIKTASLLHDIGKVGIDLQIIRKRGPLTPEDWRQVHMHPEIGARIIAQVGFLDDVAPIIKHHHERFAGGGYPEPDRKGERIPVGARVLAVADAFDAMTSSRPYKKAMTKKEAIAELKRCAGTQFDPKIVGAFIGAGIR
jgi:putative nucleotidyltransferase with HDIG domain